MIRFRNNLHQVRFRNKPQQVRIWNNIHQLRFQDFQRLKAKFWRLRERISGINNLDSTRDRCSRCGWRIGAPKALAVALSFCRLLGLGCPKQAFAKIATPRTHEIIDHIIYYLRNAAVKIESIDVINNIWCDLYPLVKKLGNVVILMYTDETYWF
jgi:hypothetical protein